MQQLLNIRNATGLGQPAMAAYLGITRQALARAEQGLFDLNTENLIKVVRLQACIDQLEKTGKKKELPCIEKSEAEQTREAECRYFATVLQRQLSYFEKTFQKNQRLYDALCLMEPVDEQESLWLQKTKTALNKKLSTCSKATCMRLRKRIYLLHAEADYINGVGNDANPNMKNPNNSINI